LFLFFSGDKYAYRAFYETELNYGYDAKTTHIKAAGYEHDDDPMDSIKNMGAKNRIVRFAESKWVELMAPIHADLFMQERFLINQCDLRIELYRNSDRFCLQKFIAADGEQYYLDIKNMSLFMKKVEVADSISLAIENMLQTTSVKYPVRRCQVTCMHITENRRSTPLNSLFSGPLPRRLVVGLVGSGAVRGDYSFSPFNFNDFGISEIKVTSGSVTIPTTPYKLDFEDNKFLRTYIQMYEGLGIGNDNKGNCISLNKFKTCCAIFVFELGPDGTDNTYWELVKEGTTTLQMDFDKAIPAGGIEAIIYAEFDSLVMIDKHRQTFMDFTV
jgi:hypothetical protein